MVEHAPGSRRPSNQVPFDESIDVNRATYEQLRALPGVGDARARAIVEWRERHGGITHIDMLRDQDLLPAEILDSLRDVLKA
jgi:competence protein ComEA